MKRETARLILTQLNTSTKALDAAEVIARQIEDETESIDFRRALGGVASSFTEVTYRIFEQFPELEKDFGR